MRTLEEALVAYKKGKADELYMANMTSLNEEMMANENLRELVNIALNDLAENVPMNPRERQFAAATLFSCLQAGIQLGMDMNRLEGLPE